MAKPAPFSQGSIYVFFKWQRPKKFQGYSNFILRHETSIHMKQEVSSLRQQCYTRLVEHSLSHMFSHQVVIVLQECLVGHRVRDHCAKQNVENSFWLTYQRHLLHDIFRVIFFSFKMFCPLSVSPFNNLQIRYWLVMSYFPVHFQVCPRQRVLRRRPRAEARRTCSVWGGSLRSG